MKHNIDLDNQKDERMAEILNISNAIYYGGIEKFSGADLKTLQQLREEGFIEPEDKHNDAPNVSALERLLKKYPELTLSGFAISHRRDDGGIVDFDEITFEEPLRVEPGRRAKIRDAFMALKKDFSPDEVYMQDDEWFIWWD